MADQAIVERTCTKLRSAIGDDEATESTGDLREMLDTLEAMHAAMVDKERLWDGFKSKSGKEWVKKVRTAANGVSDLVDEFKMQPAAGTPATGKTTTKSVELPEKMKQIKEILKGVLKEWNDFQVKNRASNPITVGAIVGRDEDREKIIAQLSARCPSEEPIILLIAGEEGVGKTTVAEMVFNDVRFRCYSRAWVNNSLELHEIGKSIISQLSGKEELSHASEDDMDSIRDRLHKLLNGMKVLVVLDDLFMASYEWEPLKQMFSVDGKGSQVIVVATTTQTWTDSVIHVHTLDLLSKDMCCTIIKQLAGGSKDPSTKKELEQIAPAIAERCGGLPLAAQLFGRLLKFKHYEAWPTLLDKSLWSDNAVDLSLELSYRSMPPNLRLCVAYCTLSYVAAHQRLVKEDLIHQWIALGLIEPSDGTISAIKLAEEYITRLLDMSFLQTANLPPASGKDDTTEILFKMHDSILQFGRNLIEADLEEVYDPEDSSVTEHCRYVVIVECDAWPSKSLLPARKISVIHCFLCSEMDLSDDSFSVPSCLRVLNLERTAIQRLPDSICSVEQLGYLNLSGCSGLVGLPAKFGELKRLLHINLSGCSGLETLPESFGELKDLRYINLSGCYGLENLPGLFGTLINLVRVNLSGCRALKNLNKKIGKLANLMHLNLSGCSVLVTLPGSFGKLIKLVHINLSNCSSLGKLPPSFGKLASLKNINLSGCSGLVTLPKSFGDLRNLLHIDLSRCYGLKMLPESFGKLPKLEHIGLSGCSGLVALPESFGGLTNLLHIDLSRCCKLSKLPGSFKNLSKLVHLDLSFWCCFEGIKIALGGLTSLQHLNLSHPCCYGADHGYLEELKGVLGNLSGLRYLNISMFLNPLSYRLSEKENLQQIGSFLEQYIGCISSLHSLEHLDLSHNIFLCDLAESLSGLHSLDTLDLSGCIRLKKLETWMTKMDSLKSVILRDCDGLEIYEFEVGVDDNINNYVQLQDVTSKVLEIRCLEKMKCLEEAERIKLVEKSKLQNLKLCWTVDSEPVQSVDDNKPDRSVQGNEPEDSVQENKLDRPVEKNESEVSVENNRPDKSVKETEPEISVERNKPCGRGSAEEIQHEVSVEENKPRGSAEEIEPMVSMTDGSVEEIQPEVSIEENQPHKSVFVNEIQPEVSVEENKPDRSVKEIEPKVSVEMKKSDSSVEKNKPDNSVKDNDLLEAFMPPQNLQCLELHGYRGKIFHTHWLSKAKLLNLVKVTMEGFPSCDILPPFDMLPNLQHLVVRRMASIKRINAGYLIGNKPIKFTIEDMPLLEEFNTTHSSAGKKLASSAIDELVVHKCPRLRFETLSTRFQKLVISECKFSKRVISEYDQGKKHEGYEYEEEGPSQLVAKSCSMPIYQWSLFHHRCVLHKLTIEKCSLHALLLLGVDSDDTSSLPEYMGHLASLQELSIVSCEDVKHLWGIIQKLTSLKSLHLSACQDLRKLDEVLGDLTSLEKLSVNRCREIEVLPQSISKLTNLKDLYILECPSLKGWCEKKESKKRLGHVQPTYELPNTSELGEQIKRS
ncbi:putative disease resistance protein RGA3 [Triticum urartu]|nr:putative disease resistance protein RGA3 [Triticum urartu]